MKSMVCAIALSLASASAALSATIQAEFWDSPIEFENIDQAIAYANDNGATATFQSTMTDYPRAGNVVSSRGTTLERFLGATDAQTLSGAGQTNLVHSVFKFTGYLDLEADTYRITVGSDDGFRLIFTENGIDRTVSQQVRPRPYRRTNGDVEVNGDTEFTLYYYENRGRTGVTFLIDGDVVDQTDLAPTPVPLPASAPLFLAGLFGLALLRRRERSTS